MLLNALLALSVTASTTLAASYSTYHRFIPSTSSSDSLPQFQPHGRVEYTSAHDGQLTMEAKQDSLIDQEDGWYQYALAVDDRMLTTFTKACMAKWAQKAVLVVHLDSSLPDAKPTSIELNYAGSDGSCPPNWQSGQDLLYAIPPKLELRIPDRIQSVPISFAPPPTVDAATGKPAEPVVEKSFLQKYWMPLLGLGLFFLTQMAPEPPAQAGKAPAK